MKNVILFLEQLPCGSMTAGNGVYEFVSHLGESAEAFQLRLTGYFLGEMKNVAFDFGF